MKNNEIKYLLLKWYLFQLLPLRYSNEYKRNGFKYTVKWWMWLGYSFCIKETKVKEDVQETV